MNHFFGSDPFGERAEREAVAGMFQQTQWDLDRDGTLDSALWLPVQEQVEDLRRSLEREWEGGERLMKVGQFIQEQEGRTFEMTAQGTQEAFHAVSMDLCGKRLEIRGGQETSYLSLIHALEERLCTVIRSPLTMDNILACVLDHGSALAMVDENGWRACRNFSALPVLVSGWRAVQIVGAEPYRVLVNDFSTPGGTVSIGGDSLCMLGSELLEVYK